MAGTWLDNGTSFFPNNWKKLKVVKAYEEGVQARLASSTPVNPFPAGEQANAWDLGSVHAGTGQIDGMSAYRGQQGPA